MSSPAPTILVLGIGNYLMGDEGVGVHAIRALEAEPVPPAVRLLDGGTGGFHLLGDLRSCPTVIIIDATMDGAAPGSVRVTRPRFATDFPRALSAHDIGLRDLIETTILSGGLPDIHLVTVSIASLSDFATELSPQVREAIPAVVSSVRSILAGLHWEQVYHTRAPDAVSWFQRTQRTSIDLIRSTGLRGDEPLIDVGGGASTLVDDLLALGYTRVAVLDIAPHALELSRKRLGEKASPVTWIEGDVLRAPLPAGGFSLWHDRALFHFLTTEEERTAYRGAVARAVRQGGFVIIASFGEKGPTSCSGLPTARYSDTSLTDALGPGFSPVKFLTESHQTPSGVKQEFIYGVFRHER